MTDFEMSIFIFQFCQLKKKIKKIDASKASW